MLPSKFNDVQKKMNCVIYNVDFSPDIFNPAIAYVSFDENSNIGDIYRIHVNNKDPELAQFLLLHEQGHVIFAHVKNESIRNNNFLYEKIHAAYLKVRKLFPSEKNFFISVSKFLLNVVMDFEVNSRLFTYDEWKYMESKVNKLLNTPSDGGFWPSMFDFPSGKTWYEYLNYILLDPLEFFTKFRFMKKLCRENAEYFYNEDFENLEKEYEQFKENHGDEKFSSEEIESMNRVSDEQSFLDFSGSYNDQFPDRLKNTSPGSDSETHKSVFETYNSKRELIRKVMKLLLVKEMRQVKRDTMYNENRRKLNTGVIVPKTVKDMIYVRSRLFILIDVSGSVNESLLNDFICTFRDSASAYKNARLITWNVKLVNDWSFNEHGNPSEYGGGTDIASGMEYVQKKYEPLHNDILFVVSDFQADMLSWESALSKMKCRKFAINWAPEEGFDANPGFDQILVSNII